METSFKHLQRITLLSFVCLSVRLTVCQAPPSSNNNQSANNGCGTCRPGWIQTLNQFSMLLPQPVMKQVCSAAVRDGFVSHCDNPYNSCGQNAAGAKQCCCPMTKLSRVQECLPKSKNACVPDKISSEWLVKFQQAFQSAFG